MKPITPDEARSGKLSDIPAAVIKVVNQLLIDKLDSYGNCTLKLCDVVAAIKLETNGEFEMKWLDFESLFRDAGWKVTYDKPGYCENYETCWTFETKRNK